MRKVKKYLSLILVVAIMATIVTLNVPAFVSAASAELAVSSLTASADDGNVPANTLDNDFNTRWSASGDGQWIKYDLGSVKTVDYLEIAFLNGDSRSTIFDIKVSTDDVSFTQVYSGQSSGTTTALEKFDFADSSARYVQIVGHGNTLNAWNSLTEVNIFGYATSPTPTPTPDPSQNLALNKSVTYSSQQTGNEASHIVDGDTISRWSAQTFPQWIRVDLGAVYNINKTEIVPYNNRAYRYEVEVSTDDINYTVAVDKTGNTTGSSLFTDIFTTVSARYIRLNVTGCYNDTTTWISLNEFRVFGDTSSTPTPTPTSTPTPTNVVSVSSISQLNTALLNAQPGQIIELADGTYNGTINQISGINGTDANNITIKSKNTGMAVFTGDSKFDFLNCSYIKIQGIKVLSSVAIGIQLNGCNNMRVTRCYFNLDEPVGVESIYLKITGASSHNRVDRCTFDDKDEIGKMIAIHGSGDQMSQYDIIDRNYFKNNTPYVSNGKETIQAGLSGYSLTNAYTTIESNLFENCSGEPEIVSLKSCNITVRYNTFRNCVGTVTARHGDRDQIYGNFFLGDGSTSGLSGIRIYDSDHKIYNNFFKGLTGTAIIVDGGDADGSGALTAHWRVYRAEVSFNTIIDCAAGITLGPSYTYSPVDCKIANNIVKSSSGTLFSDVKSTNTLWQGNIAHATGTATVGISKSSSEIQIADPLLTSAGEIYRIQSTSPATDAAVGTYSYVTTDLDGQSRIGTKDIGADEYITDSSNPVIYKPLTDADVGVNAP